MRIGFESAQHARGIVRIFERQGRRTVAGDRTAQNLQLLDARLAKSQKLISAKRRGGHDQDDAAHEKNHVHQGAADGGGGVSHRHSLASAPTISEGRSNLELIVSPAARADSTLMRS